MKYATNYTQSELVFYKPPPVGTQDFGYALVELFNIATCTQHLYVSQIEVCPNKVTIELDLCVVEIPSGTAKIRVWLRKNAWPVEQQDTDILYICDTLQISHDPCKPRNCTP